MDWQMKFNVSKCHSMRLTQLHTVQLHTASANIRAGSAKYPGLTITDNLDWGQHISEITCDATKTLSFLRRS